MKESPFCSPLFEHKTHHPPSFPGGEFQKSVELWQQGRKLFFFGGTGEVDGRGGEPEFMRTEIKGFTLFLFHSSNVHHFLPLLLHSRCDFHEAYRGSYVEQKDFLNLYFGRMCVWAIKIMCSCF